MCAFTSAVHIQEWNEYNIIVLDSDRRQMWDYNTMHFFPIGKTHVLPKIYLKASTKQWKNTKNYHQWSVNKSQLHFHPKHEPKAFTSTKFCSQRQITSNNTPYSYHCISHFRQGAVSKSRKLVGSSKHNTFGGVTHGSFILPSVMNLYPPVSSTSLWKRKAEPSTNRDVIGQSCGAMVTSWDSRTWFASKSTL